MVNPIYQALLPRALSFTARASLPLMAPTWLTATGQLDVEQLLQAFLAFWRQHGQPLLQTAHDHEIAPHLVMMAFLDRVVNGGGAQTWRQSYGFAVARASFLRKRRLSGHLRSLGSAAKQSLHGKGK